MAATARTRLVRIGNSRGIRIPKALMEQVGWAEADDVEIEAHDHQLLVRRLPPEGGVRAGWDQQFGAMAARGDDRLLDDDLTGRSHFDAHEWEW